MQKLIASILLFCFLGQAFNQGWYYLDYTIQKKEYMNRCINKARPQMHCNGKCQLMKKIAEQEKKEQGRAPELKVSNKAEVLSSKSSFLLSFDAIFGKSSPHFFTSTTGSPIDQPGSIFHPPPAFS